MAQSPLLERLIQHFNRLPGIGRKTAQRLAWYIVSGDKAFANDFADAIREAANQYHHCRECIMLTESDPCPICSDTERDHSVICIVESTADVYIFENMHEYRGRYFVLGHLLSPLDNIGPNELHLDELMRHIENTHPEEVILALKPSAEGEATIHYISELLKKHPVNVTRLATGLPFGGDLEYTSSSTLANALKRRYRV